MARPRGKAVREWWSRGATTVALGLTVLVPASPAAGDVDAVFGSATGVSVTGDLGVLPPAPTVVLSADEASPAPTFGPFVASVTSVTLPSPLPLNVFSTGALSVATAAAPLAGEGDTGLVQSWAVLRDVTLGPQLATASSISSSCTADASAVTGTTVIEGGRLFGQPFPPTPTPPPITVIPVPGAGTPPGIGGVTGTITLNEQVAAEPSGPGGGSRRLVVNAVHARLRFDVGGLGGVLPRVMTAEAVLGQVVCEAAYTNVPPAATTTTAAPAPPPVVSVAPAATRRALPETGGGSLPPGVVALGFAALLRSALRQASAGPATG